MAANSSIEWCTATWNPLAGCTPAGDDCRNCYAASMALRLEAMGQEKYRGTAKRVKSDGRAVFTGRINLDYTALELPSRWKRPQRIFVNSMSDLFHKDVPDHFILEVFAAMERAPWHIFQILTKRPDRMRAWVRKHQEWVDYAAGEGEYLRRYGHVWCGTSIGANCYTWRADFLRETPAAVRFISAEPLLSGLPSLNLDGVHWLVVGGESGPKARPMHQRWPRQLRDQCEGAGVAYFFKQHGEWIGLADYDLLHHGAMNQYPVRSIW